MDLSELRVTYVRLSHAIHIYHTSAALCAETYSLYLAALQRFTASKLQTAALKFDPSVPDSSHAGDRDTADLKTEVDCRFATGLPGHRCSAKFRGGFTLSPADTTLRVYAKTFAVNVWRCVDETPLV
ncbi:hypothetical protein ACER0C_005813 [Sarotherodon galilaeus]